MKAEKSAKRLPQPSHGSEKEEIHKLLRQYREFENQQKVNNNENENYIGVQDQSMNSIQGSISSSIVNLELQENAPQKSQPKELRTTKQRKASKAAKMEK